MEAEHPAFQHQHAGGTPCNCLDRGNGKDRLPEYQISHGQKKICSESKANNQMSAGVPLCMIIEIGCSTFQEELVPALLGSNNYKAPQITAELQVTRLSKKKHLK